MDSHKHTRLLLSFLGLTTLMLKVRIRLWDFRLNFTNRVTLSIQLYFLILSSFSLFSLPSCFLIHHSLLLWFVSFYKTVCQHSDIRLSLPLFSFVSSFFHPLPPSVSLYFQAGDSQQSPGASEPRAEPESSESDSPQVGS